MKRLWITIFASLFVLVGFGAADAQIGKRFRSEKKLVKDPMTGSMLTFLYRTPAGESKIYQTFDEYLHSSRARGFDQAKVLRNTTL